MISETGYKKTMTRENSILKTSKFPSVQQMERKMLSRYLDSITKELEVSSIVHTPLLSVEYFKQVPSRLPFNCLCCLIGHSEGKETV